MIPQGLYMYQTLHLVRMDKDLACTRVSAGDMFCHRMTNILALSHNLLIPLVDRL